MGALTSSGSFQTTEQFSFLKSSDKIDFRSIRPKQPRFIPSEIDNLQNIAPHGLGRRSSTFCNTMSENTRNLVYLPVEGVEGSWCVVQHCGVSTETEICGSEIKLIVSRSKGANWHSEFRYGPFSVTEGDIYETSFETKAKFDYKFSVWLRQFNEPYAALVSDENHFGEELANASWARFSHQWIVSRSEAKTRLVFVIGPIDNVVEFRNIKLKKR